MTNDERVPTRDEDTCVDRGRESTHPGTAPEPVGEKPPRRKHRKKVPASGGTAAPAAAPVPRPTDDAVAAAGAVLARVLEDLDSKSPRRAAEDACRGRPYADVDRIEDLIRADRGLAPIDRTAGAQARDERPEPAAAAPGTRTARRGPTKPQEDPLAAVAGLSAVERLALAEAIRAEHGG